MKAYLFADDFHEGDLLKLILSQTGLDVGTSPSVTMPAVFENWSDNCNDLIVLVSDEQETLLKKIAMVRENSQVPLLIISDTLTEGLLCNALQSGADLVLERPVGPRILATYSQVILRRAESVPSLVLSSLDLDEIILDPTTRTVTVKGQEARSLTHLEFRLLYVLMTNREQVVPVDIIVDRVWGYEGTGDRDLVRGLISRLRRKLEPDSENPHFIETISGIGYRFTLGET